MLIVTTFKNHTKMYFLLVYNVKLFTLMFNSMFIIWLCSYWTEFDKITNVEQLGQMENSLKESLNQIRTRKVYIALSYKLFFLQTIIFKLSLSSYGSKIIVNFPSASWQENIKKQQLVSLQCNNQVKNIVCDN